MNDASPCDEGERRRRGRELRGSRGAEVDEPGPLRRDRIVRQRARGAGQQPRERSGVQRRSRLREQCSRAGDDRSGGARAVDGDEARRAVGVRARVRRRERDAGRDEIRLHAAVEREARGREAGDAARVGVGGRSDGDEGDGCGRAGVEAAAERARHGSRQRDDRHGRRLVEAEPARGQRTVQQHRGRARGDGAPDGVDRCGARGDERGPARHEARAARGEEVRPPRPADLEAQPRRRSDGTVERHGPGEERRQPGADFEPDLRRRRTRVGRADRERGRRAARPRDVAVARARRRRRSPQARRRACRARPHRRRHAPRPSRGSRRTAPPAARARRGRRRSRRRRRSGRPRGPGRRSAGRCARTRPSRRPRPAASPQRGSAGRRRRWRRPPIPPALLRRRAVPPSPSRAVRARTDSPGSRPRARRGRRRRGRSRRARARADTERPRRLPCPAARR